MPWYLGNSRPFMYNWGWSMMGWSIVPLAIWSVVWTGLALWNAGKRQEKWWFIFFLLVHTLGIAEILYLVFVAKIFAQNKSSRKRSR